MTVDREKYSTITPSEILVQIEQFTIEVVRKFIKEGKNFLNITLLYQHIFTRLVQESLNMINILEDG